jgi:phosphopantetheine adenylyltransferase
MADVIDISIKQLNDSLKKDSAIESFLKSDVLIEEKTDGLKLTIIVKDDADVSKPYYENFIVAYKGNIIEYNEFDHQNTEEIKSSSIGASQFKMVWEKLKNVGAKIGAIPNGTQLFCEFLTRKPTLSSNYIKLYEIILLAYGPCKYQVKNGMLITNNKSFDYDEQTRINYAKAYGFYVPPVILRGNLYPVNDLIKNLSNDNIKTLINNNKENLSNLKFKEYLFKIEELFLQAESQFGNLPEGYVVHYDNKMLKFQQTFQLDKEARLALKLKFKGSLLEESVYWADVKRTAEELKSKSETDTVKKSIELLSKNLKGLKLIFTHPKKNDFQIIDDIQLTAKLMIVRDLADKYVIVQGKFRILTKAHTDMIRDSFKNYYGVVLNIVSNKDTKKYLDLRMKAIKLTFAKEIKQGKLEIINSTSGNINSIMRKTYNQVFGIVTGSDRVPEYQQMIDKYSMNIKVEEISRNDDDISASKIEKHIDDENYFKENTPKEIHKLYKEYRKIF